jgi:hypothetical protein
VTADRRAAQRVTPAAIDAAGCQNRQGAMADWRSQTVSGPSMRLSFGAQPPGARPERQCIGERVTGVAPRRSVTD